MPNFKDELNSDVQDFWKDLQKKEKLGPRELVAAKIQVTEAVLTRRQIAEIAPDIVLENVS